MSSTPSIRELLQVPEEQHDVEWLKKALQNAVRLELSTLPPYLCALWSIIDTNTQAYTLIRSVALEEMLHMAQACNLLTTIGGSPVFNTSDTVPTYPGPLPGGVHPGLIVPLQGLTKEALQSVFLPIELPQHGPIRALTLDFNEETFPTIGNFYDAIAAAFAKLPAEAITGQKQIAFTFNATQEQVIEIHTAADAATAIAMIEQQGEGTSQSPDSPIPDGQTELAHYYKFAEILNGLTFAQGADGKWSYTNPAIPFPDTYPIAVVPKGGYPESEAFDVLYTGLLDMLQGAWESGNASVVNDAVGTMFDLTTAALALMQTPIPGGTGNFAPAFRLHRP